jgi:Aerobic-type carbon monoxide dehydrogenase, middle subunit CoxM/CutM homologs
MTEAVKRELQGALSCTRQPIIAPPRRRSRALFAKGSESKYLAGGHTLLPVMKQRLAAPSDVIDLGRIKELVGIELSADALTIKAATTYFDILQSATQTRRSRRSCT